MNEKSTSVPTADAILIGLPGHAEHTLEREQAMEGFIQAAHELVGRLRRREEEFAKLFQITERVNHGVLLDEVLEFTFREMQGVIPYNRIGFSLIDADRNVVVARWAKSDREMLLADGYEAFLEGSTLQDIIRTGQPRIINDLEAYLAAKPQSDSTAKIVAEGMRSSLTCPLIVQGRPVGFMFFSSEKTNAYRQGHIIIFRQIAGQLSSIVEKSRLYGVLADQKAIIESHNALMTRELEMARKVQLAMIPTQGPTVDGVQIALQYTPAIQVGGDVLDILSLGEGRVMLFVGDAIGHGVQAALVMSIVKTALHMAAQGDPRPDKVLGYINRTLNSLLEDEFVTAACCLLDRPAGRMQLSLAGHPCPIVYQAGSGKISEPGDGGLPLGIRPDGGFQLTELAFAAGDLIVLCTDGVMEAFDAKGEQFGTPRLIDAVRKHAKQSAQEVLTGIARELKTHCNNQQLKDDLTLLVVKSV